MNFSGILPSSFLWVQNGEIDFWRKSEKEREQEKERERELET